MHLHKTIRFLITTDSLSSLSQENHSTCLGKGSQIKSLKKAFANEPCRYNEIWIYNGVI